MSSPRRPCRGRASRLTWHVGRGSRRRCWRKPAAPACASSGSTAMRVRACVLAAATPLQAELPVLPGASLRPLLAARLAPAELAQYYETAAEGDVELCAIALVAQAQV